MTFDFAEWLGLALRWLHMITGIAWIGSSFYFIWLDNSLKAPTEDKDIKDGVAGDLWAVHGGGFYHNKKYKVAPSHMPPDLHWFKWEAYMTWVSGFLLLSVMYYYGADLFLIDKQKMDFAPWQAIATGLAFIAGGWLLYNGLCKSALGRNNKLFGYVWFLILTAAAFALTQIFTGRGAFIHVGAMIGTVMAANVFMIIIPNQKIVVADLLAGRTPNPALGLMAKQRSLHNNYMTLPVLLIMISNHYPMLFAHSYNWLILAGLAAAAWPIRQFFNLKHKGREDFGYLALGVAGFLLVMILSSGAIDDKAGKGSATVVSDIEIKLMVRTHCSACHSDVPTHESMAAAPAGLTFDTMADIKKHAARIRAQAVDTDAMPLGNETGMTAEERQKLGAWLSANAP